MTEQIRAVNNPLTIIAIFAALAEVAGTVALATVDKSLQGTFVWFVMGFPVLLVLAFFGTLNFNPKVLYAPSDFKNEENFLNTLIGTRSVSTSLDEVMDELEEAKEKILAEAVEQIAAVGGQQGKKLTEIVKNQLNGIESRLDLVRREAQVVASVASVAALPQSSLQARILQLLNAEPQACSVLQIAEQIHMSESATDRALDRLRERGLVTADKSNAVILYRASNSGIRKVPASG